VAISILEVTSSSAIPQFAPFGVLYYAQDTGDLWIGTGFSTGSDFVGGNPGPNVNKELIAGPGGLPAGFSGDIQYNNGGVLGGSAATVDALGNIGALSVTATTATITNEIATTATVTTDHVTNSTIVTATVTSTLELQTATIVDSLGSTGTVGQALESTGTGVKWAAVSSAETWAALTGAMTYTQVAPWYNATSTVDSGISRLGAASLAIGNGTAGDFTGALKLGTMILAGGTSNTLVLSAVNSAINFGSNNSGPTGLVTWLNNSAQVKLGIGAGEYTNLDFEIFSAGLTGGAGDIAVFNHTTGSMALPSPAVYGWSSTAAAQGTVDSGISRLGAASLAIGNGTAGSF